MCVNYDKIFSSLGHVFGYRIPRIMLESINDDVHSWVAGGTMPFVATRYHPKVPYFNNLTSCTTSNEPIAGKIKRQQKQLSDDFNISGADLKFD